MMGNGAQLMKSTTHIQRYRNTTLTPHHQMHKLSSPMSELLVIPRDRALIKICPSLVGEQLWRHLGFRQEGSLFAELSFVMEKEQSLF